MTKLYAEEEPSDIQIIPSQFLFGYLSCPINLATARHSTPDLMSVKFIPQKIWAKINARSLCHKSVSCSEWCIGGRKWCNFTPWRTDFPKFHLLQFECFHFHGEDWDDAHALLMARLFPDLFVQVVQRPYSLLLLHPVLDCFFSIEVQVEFGSGVKSQGAGEDLMARSVRDLFVQVVQRPDPIFPAVAASGSRLLFIRGVYVGSGA